MAKKEIKEKKVIKEEKGNKNELRKAAFIERFAAVFIDILLIGFLAALITTPFMKGNSNYEKLIKEQEQVMKDYTDKKIDTNTYFNKVSDVSYDISKESGLLTIVSIFLYSGYFIVFQTLNKGQTLGKKLFKIRVVKENDENLSMNEMMFRSLIINSILIDIIVLCFVLFASKNGYMYGTMVFEGINYLFLIISAFMIIFRKDKRGLHDLIIKTKVIKEVA